MFIGQHISLNVFFVHTWNFEIIKKFLHNLSKLALKAL